MQYVWCMYMYYNLYGTKKMADLKHSELEIELEFERNGFTERYIFSKGSSEPKRDA